MTLEEIKDKYCIEKFGHHYDNAVYRGLVRDFQHDEIAKRYASAKLAEAAEKIDHLCYNRRHLHPFEALQEAKKEVISLIPKEQ